MPIRTGKLGVVKRWLSSGPQLNCQPTNLMLKTRFSILLLLAILDCGAFANNKALTVGGLNSIKIIGELGVPLHTVHQVECRVVDMSFTRAKADIGRLALQIISVDGKEREGKHYIDTPDLHADEKPKVGTVYHFWAYESVSTSGYPTEAFEKLGEQPFATLGLHFRSRLVVLKTLGIKQENKVSPEPAPKSPVKGASSETVPASAGKAEPTTKVKFVAVSSGTEELSFDWITKALGTTTPKSGTVPPK